MDAGHIPVLLHECIDNLNIRPDGIYVDGTLGMQKPRSDQLYYISSDATDTAVVLDQNAAEPLSLADRLGDFFSSILEYFR